MKTKVKKLTQGFTIIEVMIVLAIAGLILAIVFLAVPQLQRNARDNQRQSVVTRLKAEMDTYSSNNQGTYPFLTSCTGANGVSGEWCNFFNRYVSGGKVNINDPSTGQPVINATPATTAGTGTASTLASFTTVGTVVPVNAGVLYIVYGAKCNGESLQASGSTNTGTHTYALIIGLDRANTDYCVDNG